MQLRALIRTVYQVGRVVVQSAALFLDVDDLSGGALIRSLASKKGRSAPKERKIVPVDRREFFSRQVRSGKKGFKPIRKNRGPP